MNLGAKRAELVQKFVPRSRFGIFRNEGTRSTPLDPKLMFGAFCTSWTHLGPFGCVMKLVAKRAELVQKFVPRSPVKIFRNEGTRSTPLDPKLMFFCVSYYLTRSRVRIFRNEGTRSTRLDPKLIFWFISYNLGAFGTVWLRYETRSKTGRTSAKLCPEVTSEFFATKAPDPPRWTLN